MALTDSTSFPVSRLGDPWRLHGRVREQVSQNSVPNQLTWKYESKVRSISRVRLFATPWTEAYQAPLSMGLSRQEYWRGVPFPSPGDLPDPGIEPGSPVLQTDALRLTHQGSVTTTIMVVLAATTQSPCGRQGRIAYRGCLSLTSSLPRKYNHPHFTEEETEVQ